MLFRKRVPSSLSTGNRFTDAKRPKLGVTARQRDLVRNLVDHHDYPIWRAARRAGVTVDQAERSMLAANSPRENPSTHALNVDTVNHRRCMALRPQYGTINNLVTAMLAHLVEETQ